MRSSMSFWGRLALLVTFAAGGCMGTPDDGVASTAGAVTSIAFANLRRCGTTDPGIVEQDVTNVTAAQRSLLAARGGRIKIPVIFHVITNGAGEGDVSDLVPAQIDVLNAAYAAAGFRFRLLAIEVTQNDEWYTAAVDSPAEKQMKQALRQGDVDTLNVYTGVNDGSLLGWATFPSSYKKHPLDDGIVVFNASLPGGGLEFPFDPAQEPDGLIAYDRGDTLTHETGHWLGLFHTFQDGCTKKGDRIDDTPAEAEPQFFCVDRDSCTGNKFPGTDPIHNFMDYVDDDCMDRFTSDQNDRMQSQFAAFRQ